MERIEVTVSETKSNYELWVAEFKFATFTKTLSGRAAAKEAQNHIWKLLNYLGITHPIKAVRKSKSL